MILDASLNMKVGFENLKKLKTLLLTDNRIKAFSALRSLSFNK